MRIKSTNILALKVTSDRVSCIPFSLFYTLARSVLKSYICMCISCIEVWGCGLSIRLGIRWASPQYGHCVILSYTTSSIKGDYLYCVDLKSKRESACKGFL